MPSPRKYHPCRCTWGQLHCEHKHHFVMCRRLHPGGSKHIYMQGMLLIALFHFASFVELKRPPHALISFWPLIAHNKKIKSMSCEIECASFLPSKSNYWFPLYGFSELAITNFFFHQKIMLYFVRAFILSHFRE